jgi:RNA polymerase sigma-70 factor (ECF subfamily)
MDERALVGLARNGRADAIDELFTRLWPVVWQWAFAVVGERQLADHVAQESILRGFAALQRFDTDYSLRPWLKRITVNCAIDEIRRERRARIGQSSAPAVDAGDSADDNGDRDIADAVRALPLPQRLVIVMHYWLDCPIAEIAAILELPLGTVASRMNRARAVLRERLEVCS